MTSSTQVFQDLAALLLGPVTFVALICIIPLEDPCKGVLQNMGYGVFWYGICASLNFFVQFSLNFQITRIPIPHWSTVPKLLIITVVACLVCMVILGFALYFPFPFHVAIGFQPAILGYLISSRIMLKQVFKKFPENAKYWHKVEVITFACPGLFFSGLAFYNFFRWVSGYYQILVSILFAICGAGLVRGIFRLTRTLGPECDSVFIRHYVSFYKQFLYSWYKTLVLPQIANPVIFGTMIATEVLSSLWARFKFHRALKQKLAVNASALKQRIKVTSVEITNVEEMENDPNKPASMDVTPDNSNVIKVASSNSEMAADPTEDTSVELCARFFSGIAVPLYFLILAPIMKYGPNSRYFLATVTVVDDVFYFSLRRNAISFAVQLVFNCLIIWDIWRKHRHNVLKIGYSKLKHQARLLTIGCTLALFLTVKYTLLHSNVYAVHFFIPDRDCPLN